MSALEMLKKIYLSDESNVLILLRHTLYIARALKVNDMAQWAKNELNGYEANKAEIPSYRFCQGHLMGVDPISGNMQLVNMGQYQDLKEKFTKKSIIHSCEFITSMAYSTKKSLDFPLSDNERTMLNEIFSTNYTMEFLVQFEPSNFKHILEHIRTYIIEWVMLLEEQGIHGDGISFSGDEKKLAQQSSSIFNYTTNFYGNVNSSQLQQGTRDSSQKQSNVQ